MSADTGTMVIAGQAGGKSTFIGALTTYLRDIRRDRWQGEYNVVYGREDQFVDHIYDRISNKQAYPDQTADADTYLVRVRSHTDSGYSAERSLTMMDIPGERQEVAIDRLVSRDWAEEEIREAYEGVVDERKSIREKVDKGRGLSDEEEEKLFIYQYLSANRVIVLLNLYKFIEKYNDPSVKDPIISPELVEMAARDRRCLLLVTAADMIDYDPEDFRSGTLSSIASSFVGSPTMFDVSLREHIEQTPQLPPNQATNDIRRLVTTAKDNDASMFSVAVPEASGNRIATDGPHIQTRGFDNVAEWLFET